MKDLQQRIAAHFERVTQQDYLTVGVEQEFFLLDSTGRPVKHQTSQLFMANLIGFSTQQWDMDPILGSYIASVSNEQGNVIKYDHHPFLLEIATPPGRDVKTIEEHLNQCFQAIYTAAEVSNLCVSLDPVLLIDTDDPDTLSDLQFCRNLVAYRRKLFALRNEPVNETLINYAAGIVATQVHIGGVPYSRYNDLLPALYKQEESVLGWAVSLIKSHLSPQAVLDHRHRVYTAMFSHSPLVAKPAFYWTIDNWLDALMNTPLFGTQEEKFAGYTVNAMPEIQAMPEIEFLYRVRDLQWIKPHRQGTLEFRSTPALPDVQSIVNLCQLRLDAVKQLL